MARKVLLKDCALILDIWIYMYVLCLCKVASDNADLKYVDIVCKLECFARIIANMRLLMVQVST